MKLYFLLFLLFTFQVYADSGPVVLVGGGRIPEKAIQWMKERAKSNQYSVITLNKEKSERWKVYFDNPSFFFPEELKDIEGLGGLIIDGGDQWEYVNRLDGKIVTEINRRGIPILGTSAGAMIMGQFYFSAEKDTITSEEAEADERVCIRKDFVDIENLKNTFIESHYSERDRQRRLKVFLKKSGALVGYGIDEATALCIDSNKKQVIFGEGTVSIVKLDN